jgi:hypothetical protein
MGKLITALCVALVLLLSGCGASTVGQTRPLVADDRRPEARELPLDPRLEALPEGTPTDPPEDFVEPVEAGSCIEADTEIAAGAGYPCPSQSGILVSEARAVRDAMFRIRYPELRQTYEADRQVWAAQRELYEAQVQRDREEIERLQPTWWTQNSFAIGTAAGFILGAAVTIAITFAVDEATSP